MERRVEKAIGEKDTTMEETEKATGEKVQEKAAVENQTWDFFLIKMEAEKAVFKERAIGAGNLDILRRIAKRKMHTWSRCVRRRRRSKACTL